MRIFIPDHEAYEERRAIMEVENPGMPVLDIVRVATETSYQTPYSVALTAAAQEDWSPAQALCERERVRFGRRFGDELMETMFEVVKSKLAERVVRRKKTRR